MGMRAKVTKFFIYKFQCMKQIFFQGNYYATVTSPSSMLVFLEHKLTSIHVLNDDAQK